MKDIDIANPLFVCAYYNPHTSRDSLEKLDQSLALINDLRVKPSTIWVAGDFNLRDIDWPSQTVKSGSPIGSQCRLFLDTCTNYHLHQMVHIPTRADKILDLFLTTNESQVTKIDTLTGIGGSDHSIVRILTNVIPVCKKQPKREIFLYSKADMSSLKKDLTSFGESFVDNINLHSVQQKWMIIKDTIS